MVLDSMAGIDVWLEFRGTRAWSFRPLNGLQLFQMFLNERENHLELLVLSKMSDPARYFGGHLLHSLDLARDHLFFLLYCQKHIIIINCSEFANYYNPSQKYIRKKYFHWGTANRPLGLLLSHNYYVQQKWRRKRLSRVAFHQALLLTVLRRDSCQQKWET